MNQPLIVISHDILVHIITRNACSMQNSIKVNKYQYVIQFKKSKVACMADWFVSEYIPDIAYLHQIIWEVSLKTKANSCISKLHSYFFRILNTDKIHSEIKNRKLIVGF